MPRYLLPFVLMTCFFSSLGGCKARKTVGLPEQAGFLLVALMLCLVVAASAHADETGAKGSVTTDGNGEIHFQANGHDIRVIDGDTIEISGQVLDIAGIDAPELGQRCLHNGNFWDCGMSAGIQLRKYFVMSPFPVRCVRTGAVHAQKPSGKLDWPHAECATGDRDIAAAMIMDGEALNIPGYSPLYDDLAQRAKNAEIGVYGGTLVPPPEWREGKRLADEDGRCLFLKIDRSHYIGALDPRFIDYATTNDPTLCSDEEARAKNLSYLPPKP